MTFTKVFTQIRCLTACAFPDPILLFLLAAFDSGGGFDRLCGVPSCSRRQFERVFVFHLALYGRRFHLHRHRLSHPGHPGGGTPHPKAICDGDYSPAGWCRNDGKYPHFSHIYHTRHSGALGAPLLIAPAPQGTEFWTLQP